ncbi:hypothetical protein FJY68_04965 [candidate division WOR-3 bacterium]|uniref:T9SS type A sorting domain-containing protein n=1 Tax=candidate division WOR-3 bacterium TaxID=2052148 RepID=A0A937XF38_UNCW3|nr:hypothetical protein [candidate division WOR-3 bacterium]
MRYVRVLMAVLLLAAGATAVERWTKTYGGGADEYGGYLLQTADSGYVVAARTRSFGAGDYDYWLLRLNSGGDTLWTRTYGTGLDERGEVVESTSDGGYIICGAALVTTSGDIWLIKTNAAGDTQWTRKYPGANDSRGYVAVQTADGGYIVSGMTAAFGAGSGDIYLIKTDVSGDTQWTRTYGGSDLELGYALPTPDQGFAIGGSTSTFGSGGSDIYAVKADSLGNPIWTKTYGGANRDDGAQVILTSDGGYIMAASTQSRGAGQSDAWLLRLDSNGDTLWTRTYGGADYDEVYGVDTTADGGFIFTGQTRSFGAGGEDVWLLRTNSSGDTLWTRTFGGAGSDLGAVVIETPDLGFAVMGFTNSYGAGGYDLYMIKTDANGSLAVDAPPVAPRAHENNLQVVPSPFAYSARVVGMESEKFGLFDAAGNLVETCCGKRVGVGLAPGVYFIRHDASGESQRTVKTR